MARILELTQCAIRRHRLTDSDITTLASAANDASIASQMRDQFPHPYTEEAAKAWIRHVTSDEEETTLLLFAVVDKDSDAIIGGIGLKRFDDVERRTMELGYWLGRDRWGRGIATELVVGFSRWAFATLPDLVRLEAGVFGGNRGSARVLEKAGWTFEGSRRLAIWKNGRLLDLMMYGCLRDGVREGEEGS